MSPALPPRAPLPQPESPAAATARPQARARALPGSESPAPTLSQWLQLMLAEIAAKREALESARAEEACRSAERATPPPAASGGARQS